MSQQNDFENDKDFEDDKIKYRAIEFFYKVYDEINKCFIKNYDDIGTWDDSNNARTAAKQHIAKNGLKKKDITIVEYTLEYGGGAYRL